MNQNPQIDSAKIFVGGLSWQTTEDSLRQYFQNFGKVEDVIVMRDRDTGNPRGFAFVVFDTDAAVEVILQQHLNGGGHEIDRKIVDVKRAQARGHAPPGIHNNNNNKYGGMNNNQNNQSHQNQNISSNDSTATGNSNNNTNTNVETNKVFVGGLPLHLDRDGLAEDFAQFGPVVDSIVMMDPTHRRSRGFGFVTFENGSGGAQKALESQPHSIQGKYVEIKAAQPKENSQNFQNNKHFQNNGQGSGGSNSYGNNQNQNSNNSNNNNSSGEEAQQRPKGKYHGLASTYARNGWRAGYGSIAFGKNGWNVEGWEDYNPVIDTSGFSFSMIDNLTDSSRDSKRARVS